MEIEFLGTSGGVPSLRKHENIGNINIAERWGVRDIRTGPGIFIHDLNLLIDSSEDIYHQLRKSNIDQIEYGFYSHWHPDHTMGRRIWETLNADFTNIRNKSKQSIIYIPQRVADDFKRFLGIWEHLEFMESEGYIKLKILNKGESINIKETKITPFPLYEEFAYGLLFEKQNKRILIIPDEVYGWVPEEHFYGIDIAVLPFGHSEFNLKNGKRNYAKSLLEREREAKFEDVLEIVTSLNPKKTYITHIEQMENLSYIELKQIEADLYKKGIDLTFAYDQLRVEI